MIKTFWLEKCRVGKKLHVKMLTLRIVANELKLIKINDVWV